ncbi:MAG: hypothetical protein LAP61_24940 [Acidobacteriia bacterium]|nr:hypothetical protein [Terriglobia bacterium]
MRNRHGKGEDLDSLRSEIESIAAGSEEASRKVDARVETVKGQIADNADRRAKLQHARDSLKAKVVKLRVSIPASLVEDVKNGKDFRFAGEMEPLAAGFRDEMLAAAYELLSVEERMLNERLEEDLVASYAASATRDFDKAEVMAFARLCDLGPAINAAGGMPWFAVELHLNSGEPGNLRETARLAAQKSNDLTDDLYRRRLNAAIEDQNQKREEEERATRYGYHA